MCKSEGQSTSSTEWKWVLIFLMFIIFFAVTEKVFTEHMPCVEN